MVDARAQEEALLHVDAHLSIRQISNVWQIAVECLVHRYEGTSKHGLVHSFSEEIEQETSR